MQLLFQINYQLKKFYIISPTYINTRSQADAASTFLFYIMLEEITLNVTLSQLNHFKLNHLLQYSRHTYSDALKVTG